MRIAKIISAVAVTFMAFSGCDMLPRKKTTTFTIDNFETTFERRIVAELGENQFVNKRSICIKGMIDSPVTINNKYVLVGKIDTCFKGDYYFPTDSIRIISNSTFKGSLEIEHVLYY